MENELVDSSKILEIFFKYSAAPVAILDKNFNCIKINDAHVTAFGYSLASPAGTNYFSSCFESLKLEFEKAVKTKLTSNIFSVPLAACVNLKQKTTYWDIAIIPILGEDAQVSFLAVFFKETGLCSQIEDKLRIASRALKTLRSCNQVFIRATKEKDLLKEICDIIVNEGGYACVWVGLVEHGEHKSIKPVAWKDSERNYAENLNIVWLDAEYRQSSIQTVMQTAKPYIMPDFSGAASSDSWRDAALKRGYQSLIVLPLVFNKQIFGILSIYAKEKNAFTYDDKELLSELADNLSYGLTGLRFRIEHHNEHHKTQHRIENAFAYTVGALARAAEANDNDTGNHILRVGNYCAAISEKLKMPRKFIETIRLQAELHDVGKIHVPQAILKKPDTLTKDEWDEMKKHPIYGAAIVGSHPLLKMAGVIALNHHEKWNGSGYPYGLKGEAIPLEGRIVALADQYDAMRNERVYKPAFDHETAYEAIIKGDGRTNPNDFDPNILYIFKKSHLEFDAIYRRLKSGHGKLRSKINIESEGFFIE